MARIAVMHKNKCNYDGCGNYLCIKLCPVNRTGHECIIKGDDNKPIIDENICTGCGICQNRCPFDAISIINLPQELNTTPIHRYGKNGFALYSLPSPVFGKVTGILGKNGIGKSTAIKIFADIIKPNFGREDKTSNIDDLISFFRGTEKQNFFENLKKGKIITSYKPQSVDLIPKTVKGKVKDLLLKVDEINSFDKIINQLDLNKILDKNIDTISGGELQRVAIAATVLKKANLYIFDEPTSYLDIKQRLLISKFIKNLANENTSVLVIEHDIVALDYMADIINIMYGKEDAYGVVSHPRTAKEGINVFLEGNLKEENIRFRDYKIKFEIKAPIIKKKENILTNWDNIKKKFFDFSLELKKGEIFSQEILGVVGENGIGKTTFMKILSGIEKTDSGKIDKKIKISYKPQYIDNNSDELIANILHNAIKKNETELIKPLNLQGLLTRKLNEISGGQLQRVAIAKALSEDCDVVLLDEPSAYLDIEQRLVLSKIILNILSVKNISIVVVDHDLVFIDSLANRIIFFDGTPAVNGIANEPINLEEGMNMLLEKVQITLRREMHSGRPRINKYDSTKDKEQKKSGKYYYS
ncbi:MAG: ribosome biogenesis/translation initiation ATPase RLI [Candidatus Woesearchaeota archaeon]